MRYAMMIELDKCIGCQACVTSCKERWDTGPQAARDWVMSFTQGSRTDEDLGVTFYPGLCNHCDDHPCTTDCPTQATYMNEHGVVVVDKDICIGCGNCVPKCPYGARHPDARKGIVEKCNFCEPYVRKGLQPACVASCLAECRHFGDISDSNSPLSLKIKESNAKPLVTNEINIGPHVYYTPRQERRNILAQGVVRRYKSTLFTQVYTNITKPISRYGIPPLVLLTGMAGMALNFRRKRAEQKEQQNQQQLQHQQQPKELSQQTQTVERHKLGMRLLHWFNVFCWLVLIATGTALMSSKNFALFGDWLPQQLSKLFGSTANVILFHALWGMLWGAIIIPFFLYFKKGGFEAIKEIWPTVDDVRWLFIKPFVMVGFIDEKQLPPQDKYNFGQKLFAISALGGTSVIIITGLIMTFHLGSPEVIRLAIMFHKLAIMFALIGIAVHLTMAAILVEERPALKSMITGSIDLTHAKSHSSKWISEIEEDQEQTDNQQHTTEEE